jgi:hypothetical protein
MEKKIVNIWKTLISLFATVTVSGMSSIFVVPIEPVEEEDEYADLPIYERIQLLLLDYYVEVHFLLHE